MGVDVVLGAGKPLTTELLVGLINNHRPDRFITEKKNILKVLCESIGLFVCRKTLVVLLLYLEINRLL